MTTLFEIGITKTATLSPCELYRYELGRRWGDGGYVNFIGLNPSTADATIDDPTIRKCVKFARLWGYDAMVVTNLFAWRDTDLKKMKKAPEPIGEQNNEIIRRVARNADLVIVAWGENGIFMNRAVDVLALINKPVHCLRISEKTGQPWHPLYIPDATTSMLFKN